MRELEGRKILVVGASSGIGEKTAEVLADQGAEVILVARREELLKGICDKIGCDRACYYVADISDINGIENLINQIVSDNGKLDGMVYASGFTLDYPLKFITYERLIDVFNVNYFGFMECVRQVTRKSCYNKGMRIVGISSIASRLGERAHTIYSASKAAMDASVRCLAKELWKKGISLNTVQPAMIGTQMYYDLLESQGEDSEANRRLLDRQYCGIGEPVDVANAIAFLISPKAKFLTGLSMPVDGGTISS